MLQAVVLLAFLLQPIDGYFTSHLHPRNSDLTKIKCDALPYRTVYLFMNCYFVIEADVDKEKTSKECWRILKGATFTGSPPDEVYITVFENKNDFLRDGSSTGSKKKAMCVYDMEAFSHELAGTPNTNQTSSEGSSNDARPFIKYILPQYYYNKFKVEVGQTIVVKATFHAVTIFVINFHTADHTGPPIPFHLDTVFATGKLALTSYLNGQWQVAQTYPTPFRMNQLLEIRIVAHQNHFQVIVDQKEIGTFNYRAPLAQISHFALGMDGPGIVHSIDLGEKEAQIPPPRAMIKEIPVCIQTEKSRDVCNRAANNTSQAECKALVISGSSFDGTEIITIDFLMKNNDVALHFNPNFKTGTVLVTSAKGGQFANDGQTFNIAPFKKKVPFEVAFTRDPCAFQIYVDGVHFATFPHRFPPSEIDTIKFRNIDNLDIQIKSPGTPITKQPSAPELITFDLPQYYTHQFKIKLGQTIVVRMTFRAVTIFAINLHTGGSIPFHMDTVFAKGEFSLNNFMTGHWDNAESQPTPIRMYQPFEIRIVARENDFQVFVDDRAFATYKYRVPLDQINYFILGIDGIGSLDYLDLGGDYTPVVRPSAVKKELPQCTSTESKSGVCNRDQEATNRTLAECKSLVIAGQSSDGDVMVIDFLMKNGDVALRFNPNFKTGTVVLNSAKGGQWSTEGKTLNIGPFKYKVRFEVAFTRDHCAFQIYVDGAHFASFPHRFPPSEIYNVQLRYINNLDIQIK